MKEHSMINAVIQTAAIVAAVVLFASVSWKFKHKQIKDAWVDIVSFVILMSLLHRTISGISMGIILIAAFSLYTAFYPITFNLFGNNTKRDN